MKLQHHDFWFAWQIFKRTELTLSFIFLMFTIAVVHFTTAPVFTIIATVIGLYTGATSLITASNTQLQLPPKLLARQHYICYSLAILLLMLLLLSQQAAPLSINSLLATLTCFYLGLIVCRYQLFNVLINLYLLYIFTNYLLDVDFYLRSENVYRLISHPLFGIPALTILAVSYVLVPKPNSSLARLNNHQKRWPTSMLMSHASPWGLIAKIVFFQAIWVELYISLPFSLDEPGQLVILGLPVVYSLLKILSLSPSNIDFHWLRSASRTKKRFLIKTCLARSASFLIPIAALLTHLYLRELSGGQLCCWLFTSLVVLLALGNYRLRKELFYPAIITSLFLSLVITFVFSSTAYAFVATFFWLLSMRYYTSNQAFKDGRMAGPAIVQAHS